MKNHAVWLAIGATISIFAIVTWMMLDNACSDLGNAREVSECWRDWVGAWSGWFAGSAAVATLYLIWRTVLEAQKSNKILEKQTKVVTGELDPVFNHNGKKTSDKTKEIFRFWNYNRRAITVDGVEVLEPPEVTFAFLSYKLPGSSSPQKTHNNFTDGGRKFMKTFEVSGTPVGQQCNPAVFEIAFYQSDTQAADCDLNLTLKIHWRFQDANHAYKETTDCKSEVTVYALGKAMPV